MVAAYQIKAMVSEDRKLVIELPEDFPAGEVTVQVEAAVKINDSSIINPAREAALAKMRAAGALATGFEVPQGTVLLSPEELLRVGTLPPGSPSSLDLIDQDRGER